MYNAVVHMINDDECDLVFHERVRKERRKIMKSTRFTSLAAVPKIINSRVGILRLLL